MKVVFLSGILGASVCGVNTKYHHLQDNNTVWSTLVFPLEQPSDKDFKMWHKDLWQVVPDGGLLDAMGWYLPKRPKI